jgi:hypothetical protein
MSRFVVWEVCFLPLSGNGDEIGWLGSSWRILGLGFDERGGGIYDVNNFHGAMTWRIRFSDGDTEAGMVSSSWNNFLRSLLSFVIVRSNNSERLVRISMSSIKWCRSVLDHKEWDGLSYPSMVERGRIHSKEEENCARSSLKWCC